MPDDLKVTYRELVKERKEIEKSFNNRFVNKDQFETLKQKVDMHDKYLWLVISVVVGSVVTTGLAIIFK